MRKASESKGFLDRLSRMSPGEALRVFIRGAVFTIVVATPACNGDNNNNPDGGDTDSGTDPVADCSNTEYQFGTFPTEKCFCPGDGDQVLTINDPGNILDGIKARFKEGTFDKCVIATISRPDIPDDAFGEDADGAMTDAQNEENKDLSQGALEVKAISADDPYTPNTSGSPFNEVQPSQEVEFEFPSYFGTVMKWMPEADIPHFEKVKPTTIDTDGSKYLTDSFSAYAVFNRPFSSFTTSFVPGGTNGYDINEDGVLVQIDLGDEEQTEFPSWVTFKVSDGTDTYELISTETVGQFRLPVFEGQHDLAFIVSDNNTEVAYRHSAEEDKSIDLDTDLCEDVVCPDDGDVCNGEEDCDPSDGECKSFDPLTCDNGDVCDGDETCDPVEGCVDGTPLTCDNDDVCDGLETCDPVTGCEAGTPLTCDDSDECTENNCDPATGCDYSTPVVCDDSNVCNGTETCDSVTGCQSGTPLTCDDGLACNGVETCDSVTGCTDPEDVDCGSHGSCVEPSGTCDCTDGYTGDNCETPPYTFEDSCNDNGGVIDGSACWVLANPLENCDTACDILDSVVNGIAASCASGEWDDTDGSKCNALTGGIIGYTANAGFAPFYHTILDRCYQRDDAYVYTSPDTVCNMIPNTNTLRICKCE